MCLFGCIWVKSYFPLISPFANFNEIVIPNHCRNQSIINGRDVSSAKKLTKDSKLSGISFMYPKERKDPSIEPYGIPARICDQL